MAACCGTSYGTHHPEERSYRCEKCGCEIEQRVKITDSGGHYPFTENVFHVRMCFRHTEDHRLRELARLQSRMVELENELVVLRARREWLTENARSIRAITTEDGVEFRT